MQYHSNYQYYFEYLFHKQSLFKEITPQTEIVLSYLNTVQTLKKKKALIHLFWHQYKSRINESSNCGNANIIENFNLKV